MFDCLMCPVGGERWLPIFCSKTSWLADALWCYISICELGVGLLNGAVQLRVRSYLMAL